MPQSLQLSATLEPRGPAGAIVLDDDQVAKLGDGRRTFPVRVTVGGTTVPLRLARRGEESLIGFARAVREELGVELGDRIDVLVELDDEPREVQVPSELESVLAREPAAREAFDALAPSRRKELARQVAEAKKPATRDARIERIMDELRGGAA